MGIVKDNNYDKYLNIYCQKLYIYLTMISI
jgi:hypothetical protein